MKINYIQKGDYLIPDWEFPPQPEEELTKYGQMRWNYLREQKHPLFTKMLVMNTLKEHCLEIQNIAQARYDLMMEGAIARNGITPALKEKDQMEWVRRMTTASVEADHLIQLELIYT